MRLSFSSSEKSATTFSGRLAELAVDFGQSEDFEQFTSILQNGLQALDLEGCFLLSCFGFNRETRFGGWSNRYVFPLRADLTDTQSRLYLRDNLIVVRSGYFTLVMGNAAELQAKNPTIADNFLVFSEAARLWVVAYTLQVSHNSDSSVLRKIACKQLLAVVDQLDHSGCDAMATYHRAVTAINAGISQAITQLDLTEEHNRVICDEFDEVARSYSIFTKQQMELNQQIKEQVRAIAGLLLSKEP